MADNTRLRKIATANSELLDAFAMKPIFKKSLLIQNGVMYIIGGVSSGKSTLISKLIKIYDETINPLILCLYSGFAPDETTQFNISSYDMKSKPFFIKLESDEAFISFFNQLRVKRLKISELLLFVKSILRDKTSELIETALALFDGIERTRKDYDKRFKMLLSLVTNNFNIKNPRLIYWSEYVLKTYAKRRKMSFDDDPLIFVCRCLISLSKGLKPLEILIPDSSESKKYKLITLPNILRMTKGTGYEVIPSVSIFDDVAQFRLLTTERSSQWVKDLFAETRRWKNTFIIAAQRYNLLNKSLRSLTHTFFIGFSLIDDDLPKISKEMPSNLLGSSDFMTLYKHMIKPFTFFVYNNKLGFNFINT